MHNIFTKLSNYREFNLNRRKDAARGDVFAWEKQEEAFIKYRHEWKRSAENDYLPLHPLHVDIELSDCCNLRCRMCVKGLGPVSKGGFMAPKLALRLIKECSDTGVYSIKFNWRGEATLSKFLPDAVRAAKENGILEVQINTNGLPQDSRILIECAKGGIDRIIFSIDGFSKPTYEKIRVGGDYKKLLNNIRSLLSWKKNRRALKPLVRVQLVRTKENACEVNDFISYWEKRVNDVRISDVTNRGQGNELMVGDQIPYARRRCPQPFQRLVIARDGKVSPCCADWFQEYVVGDVARESLMQIWRGKKIEFLRGIQRNNEHTKIGICSSCSVKESYLWKRCPQAHG